MDVSFDNHSISIANRWNHIYRCYKAELERRDGFAELCFQCDEWITSGRGWHEHCRRHLDDLETLPVQCNPLAFRQTLATAGHCLFCLFDSNLPPTKRFHQFLIKQSWKEHLHSHFRKLEEKYDPLQKPAESKAVPCPDPRCALSFDSLGDLQCHCQDVHCIERIKRDPAKRRRRTRQSWVDTKNCSGTSAMPESWSGYISEGMDVLTSKSLSTVAPAGQTSPEASDSIRSPSISSTCSAASHEKRSPSAASFGASKNPPTSIGWTSDEGMPGTDTPASSACPSPKMLIDPRLLEESESQLIVLSP